MNELNKLLEAAGDIDDNILERSLKPRKFSRAYIVIALAAALTLLMGAVAVHINGAVAGDKRIEYRTESQSDINILTEQELRALGAQIEDFAAPLENMYPSEVFSLYNISPLMNENFTEEKGTYIWHYEGNNTFINFSYSLTDNETGVNLGWIFLDCPISDEYDMQYNFKGYDASEIETITLNDGSEAMIFHVEAENAASGSEHCIAVFSYEGMVYDFTTYTDKDTFMGILDRLGIL